MKRAPNKLAVSLLVVFGSFCTTSQAWPETLNSPPHRRPLARPDQSATDTQAPFNRSPEAAELSNNNSSASGDSFDVSACLKDYVKTAEAAALAFLNDSDAQSSELLPIRWTGSGVN